MTSVQWQVLNEYSLVSCGEINHAQGVIILWLINFLFVWWLTWHCEVMEEQEYSSSWRIACWRVPLWCSLDVILTTLRDHSVSDSILLARHLANIDGGLLYTPQSREKTAQISRTYSQNFNLGNLSFTHLKFSQSQITHNFLGHLMHFVSLVCLSVWCIASGDSAWSATATLRNSSSTTGEKEMICWQASLDILAPSSRFGSRSLGVGRKTNFTNMFQRSPPLCQIERDIKKYFWYQSIKYSLFPNQSPIFFCVVPGGRKDCGRLKISSSIPATLSHFSRPKLFSPIPLNPLLVISLAMLYSAQMFLHKLTQLSPIHLHNPHGHVLFWAEKTASYDICPTHTHREAPVCGETRHKWFFLCVRAFSAGASGD